MQDNLRPLIILHVTESRRTEIEHLSVRLCGWVGSVCLFLKTKSRSSDSILPDRYEYESMIIDLECKRSRGATLALWAAQEDP